MGSNQVNFEDALSTNDGGLLTLEYNAGNTQLTWIDGDMKVFDRKELSGSPIMVLGTENDFSIITSTIESLAINQYSLSDDVDSDGINNTLDAFPTDVAASLDSDDDGFPDFWNDGYGQDDSTRSLTLDTFPNIAACWLKSHEDASGNCDYSATMPSFEPDQIIVDKEGVIYLFSAENHAIFRWSVDSANYIEPIYLPSSETFNTPAPLRIAHSDAHKRLYFGYRNGEIKYVDLADISTIKPFAKVVQSVDGLVATGNFILVQDGSGAWESHFLFDVNGNEVENQEWNTYSRTYAWNEHNNRVYFFRDGTSPNDLHFHELNQTSGKIVESGETPYHGGYSIQPPIVISADGQLVLLGSGDLYNADTLEWSASIASFDDAVWLESNDLVTITKSNDNTFKLLRKNDEYINQEVVNYTGDFLRVVQTGEKTYIISLEDEQLQFIEYTVNNDSDGDGVDNLTDAFALDPSASTDVDNDGYPDQWNAGKSAADSTTGLILDSFPNDSACWLSEHDNGSGQCDYSATIPSVAPAKVISDEQGMLYFFYDQLGAVYRWSAQTQSYINPIYVGGTDINLNNVPTLMDYSQAHNRLYFGYDSGEITFVDLTNLGQEQRFTQTALSVGGLVAAGNYVMAEDASGAWNSHYVFDVNATAISSEEWREHSRVYTWNENNNRIYYFDDGSSPNDIHYTELNTSTGATVKRGESPYHGDYRILPPIRIVNNGNTVLLGSGDLYDADTLEISHQFSFEILDAAAFEEFFVIAKAHEQGNGFSVQVYTNDYSHQTNYEYDREFVSIHRYQDALIVVTLENGELNIESIAFGDQDSDNLPAWWEQRYGLSDEDSSDAATDLDGDGLTNAEEFTLGTSPDEVDSDNDQLTDFEESRTYSTDPLVADTDSDGLTDHEEINTHSTDPLAKDTDSDGFSDGQEVIQYSTNPVDETSVPQAITSIDGSFESGLNQSLWKTTEQSNASWTVSTSESSVGTQSIRAGVISDFQTSSVTFSALFAAGTLTFDAKVSSESCCDVLRVYVNDELKLTLRHDTDWQTQNNIILPQGEHVIRWSYEKDSSASSGEDTAWIDNVQFTAQ